jgi:hypothetical protein
MHFSSAKGNRSNLRAKKMRRISYINARIFCTFCYRIVWRYCYYLLSEGLQVVSSNINIQFVLTIISCAYCHVYGVSIVGVWIDNWIY